jgi:hypothetical protein
MDGASCCQFRWLPPPGESLSATSSPLLSAQSREAPGELDSGHWAEVSSHFVDYENFPQMQEVSRKISSNRGGTEVIDRDLRRAGVLARPPRLIRGD